MNRTNQNQITTLQFVFLIHGTQLGVGMLQLPRVLAETAGTDGWISILINWILSTAAGLLVIQIMKSNSERTMPHLFNHYFGKWIGTFFSVFFTVFFMGTAFVEILRDMLFVKVWLLPETPDYIILIAFAVPGYMIIRRGIQILGRYAELMFFCLLWLPILYLLPLKEGITWLNMLPIYKESVEPIFKASVESSYAFFGSEIAFIIYPMLQKKKYAAAGMIAGNTLTMLAYLLATIVCFVYFGPDVITRYNEPSVSVLKTIEFRFIERLEIIMFTFYLLAVFKTWMSFLWAASYNVGEIIGEKYKNSFTILFLLITVIYTILFFHTFDENDKLQDWLGITSLFASYAFPVCMYLFVLLYERIRRERL